MRTLKNTKKGYSLLEVIISVALVSVFYTFIYAINRVSNLTLQSSNYNITANYIAFGASNLLIGTTKDELNAITDPKSILIPLNISNNLLNKLTITIDSNNRTVTCSLKGEVYTCKIP